MKWKLKDTSQVGSETFDIIKIDSESIEYKNYSRPDEIYKFNYRGNLIDTIITGEYKGVKISKCSETKTIMPTKVEIASMIDKAKDTCKSLGFNEGTDKFADCALKLYSQSVELAAKQNQQIVMQPQSSGSNVMTIYDPVRDSNALMDKGMKMITGRCTLGYNC